MYVCTTRVGRQVTGNDVLLATGSRGGFHLCHLRDAPVGCKACEFRFRSVCALLWTKENNTQKQTPLEITQLCRRRWFVRVLVAF